MSGASCLLERGRCADSSRNDGDGMLHFGATHASFASRNERTNGRRTHTFVGNAAARSFYFFLLVYCVVVDAVDGIVDRTHELISGPVVPSSVS